MATAVILLTFAVISVIPLADSLSLSSSNRCQAIPLEMRLCQDVGYSEMSLPPNSVNLAGVVKELLTKTDHWLSLVATGCHGDLRILLCSVYAPVCVRHHYHLPSVDGSWQSPIRPCRSLCLAVRKTCSAVMLKFGASWPAVLNCTQFPPDTDLMCIKGATAAFNDRLVKPEPEIATVDCDTCPEKVTYGLVIGSYCLSEFALKVRIQRVERVPRTISNSNSNNKNTTIVDHLLLLHFHGRPRVIGRAPSDGQLPTTAEIDPRCSCSSLETSQLLDARQHYLITGYYYSREKSASSAKRMRVRLLAKWSSEKGGDIKRSARAIRRVSGLCDGDGEEDRRRRRQQRRRRRRQRRLRRMKKQKRLRRNGSDKAVSGGEHQRKQKKKQRKQRKKKKVRKYSYDGYYYINYNPK